MFEANAVRTHRAAYAAWEAAPSYVTARTLHAATKTLVRISDDHTCHMDEADDILNDVIAQAVSR
jgi:cell division GTPase FtsZ